ncbi:hypothetical protein LXA43DRAFT_527059 [Ganoderma leucocontextum]|nr:hypothetical protein LXA43DRAFT_527059 [Ganoderma leucocontextum]
MTSTTPTPTALLVLFLSLPAVLALPLHSPTLSPPSFQPLPFLFTLLPFPVLATLKYLYLRFRRGQSIHAVPHSLRPQSSTFYLALNPYLVGIFGSPHWETTISCRHASLAHSAHNPPPLPLSLHPHSSHSDNSTTNTSTLVSSFSRKSRSTPCHLSRSSLPHTSLPYFPTPLHPHRPPSAPLVPPSIHVSSSLSPTLMQIMAPVLNSSYHQSSLIPPTFILPTDQSSRISTLTTHSSLFFRTSLIPSPPPIVPSILLPKQQPASPPSSTHSFSPSPASLSLAVFHSPLAPRIPVPKPVYTPSLRPESCVVLPRDWPTGQEITLAASVLPSPTYSSPPSHSSTVFNSLSNAVDPILLPTRPLAILKSPRKLPRYPSPPLGGFSVSPPSLPAITQSPTCRTPSPALSFFRSSQCQEWELADLHDLDGRLDIDAISRALGLGLGLGLPVAASVSNHDSDGSEHASSSYSGSAVESEDASDFDVPLDGHPNSGSYIKSSDCGPREGDLATFLGISVQMHVHGQPLSVIPEETRSEMDSGVDEDDEDLSAGPDISAVDSYGEKTDVEGAMSNAQSANIIWDASWREGESIARLSIGVAC